MRIRAKLYKGININPPYKGGILITLLGSINIKKKDYEGFRN